MPRPPAIKPDEKLTARQEMFVLQYASHGNATRAYMEVFGTAKPKLAREEAWRMLQRPAVQARLHALHEASEAGTLVDHHRLCLMYLEAFSMAKQKGNDIGMTAATTQLAKLGGFMIERSLSVQKQTGEMTNGDLRAELERIDDALAKLASAGVKAAALPPPKDPPRSRGDADKPSSVH